MKKKSTVLVVDDNINFANLLSEHINEQEELEVVSTAKNGLIAIEKLREFEPDLLVLDIIMPYMDGLSVLEEMNKLNLKKNPKIIVLSAVGQDEITRNALKLGADFYIIKPFDFSVFLTRVKQLLVKIDSETEIIEDDEHVFSSKIKKEENLDIVIGELLDNIGVPAHIKGYHYIRDAIKLMNTDFNNTGKITTFIYPSLAEKYNTTSTRVERAIRNAIEITIANGEKKLINKLFSKPLARRNGKVSNGEFITIVADKIRIGKKIKPKQKAEKKKK
ncbi:sporulation transcription factor Spo0A [Helicovermis profundi]|uniref:Stage 0 sporulation protein A homolog n=1 Tax=Helicovermis profundi TaxID=3065157 RepID=A0AAU9E368_9FIRM|nr:sporulation transcription factor Spo0A [Clostridia bacterium S502]